MYEMSAPKLMLLQYNAGSGKQELGDVKLEMENLIVTIRNVFNNYQVFEEGKERGKVETAKALSKDARDFYTKAILSRM